MGSSFIALLIDEGFAESVIKYLIDRSYNSSEKIHYINIFILEFLILVKCTVLQDVCEKLKNSSNILYYRDSFALFYPDRESKYGKVINIGAASVTFQGENILELEQSFREAIDLYIELCKEQGREPHSNPKYKEIIDILKVLER